MALLFPAYAGVIPVFRLCPIVARTFPRLAGVIPATRQAVIYTITFPRPCGGSTLTTLRKKQIIGLS